MNKTSNSDNDAMLLLNDKKPGFFRKLVSCFKMPEGRYRRAQTHMKQRPDEFSDIRKRESIQRTISIFSKRDIDPEKMNNAMAAISKIREITMMDPNKKISSVDLETR